MTTRRAVAVSGAAGFIGTTLVDRLLADGWDVIGIDNFDDFYDPALKRGSVEPLLARGLRLSEIDLRDLDGLTELLDGAGVETVVHLAALAGVRPSAERPLDYYDVNVVGTSNVLEAMGRAGIAHLVFASSSSIYGINPEVPWTEDRLPQPVSVYANSKLAGERLVARWADADPDRTAIAARLFTVFGPGQRPDLAITNFASRMLNGEPIEIYGDGSALRDFTYVDDIVAGLRAAMTHRERPFTPVNFARGEQVQLITVVEALQDALGLEATIEFGPPVRGDVPQTWGSIERAAAELGYQPATDLRTGLSAARPWFERVAAVRAGALRPAV